ncbi:MAG TPA: NYN domain-containing protein [Candidatus Saccharimonadales bacterium]|nr:NYN domain-containing protein [Candidatus Saccharimonadales bacterium]
MGWIVDGNNLLAQIPGRSMTDLSDRRALASSLARFCESRRSRMLLCFDGPPSRGEPRTSHLGRLRIEHSGAGRTADEVILSAVSDAPRPGDLTVVTSDRSLSDRCRSLGARTATVREFRSALSKTRARSRDGAEKPERPEPSEVAYFLELFSGGSDGDSSDPRRRR